MTTPTDPVPPQAPPLGALPDPTSPNPTSMMISGSTLLARGIGLLLISFILVVLLAGMGTGADRTRIVIGWAEQAAFWVGIICIAGDVLNEVLTKRHR